MLPLVRYDFVLWSYPPHNISALMPEIIQMVDIFNESSVEWNLEGQPNIRVCDDPRQWLDLAESSKNRSSYNSINIFLESKIGLSMGVSLNAPSFVRDFDVLNISFDMDHVDGDDRIFTFKDLLGLFRGVTKHFRPFWARIEDTKQTTSDDFENLRLKVDRSKVPDTIHWFNFLCNDTVARLGGREKFCSNHFHAIDQLDNPSGLLLVLQEEPFNCMNPSHYQKQQIIVDFINLGGLHKKYLKIK